MPDVGVSQKPLKIEGSQKPLQKVTEIAQQLNCSRAYVYVLMERGELPYVQLGRIRRVRCEDVEKLLAVNTVGK